VGTYLQGRKRGKVQWHVVDAAGVALGRLSSRAALLLMGKHSPGFTPHEDHRDGLIVVNCARVVLTARKLDQKIYRRHTGYPGGLKEISARKYMSSRPEALVREAILGMLPKSRLGSRMARRLRVYAGPTHAHAVQKPVMSTLSR
jgi:large subunit ribosomal protein L13